MASCLNLGPKLGDCIISDTDFADNLAILQDSPEQLLEAFQILWKEAANVRLQINRNKTKIMAIDTSFPAANSPVSLDKKN